MTQASVATAVTWPVVPLRELLTLRNCDVEVSPMETYQFAGVKSFGGGVFRSASKEGSSFSYKHLTRLREDDFVYPKLMAWEGALGVVPESCNGLVVSPEFCVFTIRRDRLMPSWMGLYFRQASVWPTLAGGSAGTNIRRRRIYPQDFLDFSIPLPPLGVQTSLAARIAEIEALLIQAIQLRREASVAIGSLTSAARTRHFAPSDAIQLGQVVSVLDPNTTARKFSIGRAS